MNLIDTLRLFLYFTALGLSILFVYALIRRKSHLARLVALASVASLVYVAGYASELGARSVEDLRFWLTLEYFGAAFASAIWLIVAYKLRTGHSPNFIFIATVLIIPVITVFMVSTTWFHGLYYKDVRAVETGGRIVAELDKGPWYWLFMIYSYATLLVSVTVIAATWKREHFSFKTASFWMLAGPLLYIMTGIAYQTGMTPKGIDPGPLALAAGAVLYAIPLIRHGAFLADEIMMREIFAGINEAVIVLDPMSNISSYNQAAGSIFAWLVPESIGRPVTDYEDAAIFLGKRSKLEKIVVKDGMTRYYEGRQSTLLADSRLAGTVYFFKDVTSLRKMVKRLYRLAAFDALTGIYNRRHFMESCARELTRPATSGKGSALLLIDLDHFKMINDRQGHVAGDMLLAAIGTTMKACVKDAGFAGRYGGDEFILFLRDCDEPFAREFALGLRSAVEAVVVRRHETDIQVTASVGVAHAEGRSRDGAQADKELESLIASADDALYSSKRAGRNRITVVHTELQVR